MAILWSLLVRSVLSGVLAQCVCLFPLESNVWTMVTGYYTTERSSVTVFLSSFTSQNDHIVIFFSLGLLSVCWWVFRQHLIHMSILIFLAQVATCEYSLVVSGMEAFCDHSQSDLFWVVNGKVCYDYYLYPQMYVLWGLAITSRTVPSVKISLSSCTLKWPFQWSPLGWGNHRTIVPSTPCSVEVVVFG